MFSYPKELCELHNDYPLAPDKIEIKKKLSKYQMMIADFLDIPIGDVKKLVPNLFDKKKYVLNYRNLQLYLTLGLTLKSTSCIRIQSITMATTICRNQHTQKKEVEKNCDKDGKALYKLISNADYSKKKIGKLEK